MQKLKHLPSLDGIRGLAILLVMIAHLFWIPAIPFLASISYVGWTGVDLFFVLSGFLITSILDEARGKPHALKFFYIRRALRIFPLYYAYLVAYFLLVVQFKLIYFGEAKTQAAAQDLHWMWFYGTNFLIAKQGQFITASLNHFWSLAIEEHFYLFWPAIILFLSRKRSIAVCVWIAVISFTIRSLMIFRFHIDPYAVRMLTPGRIDTFAIGGLLALSFKEWPRLCTDLAPVFKKILAGLSVALVIFYKMRGGLSYTDPVMQSIGYTLLAFSFAALIAVVMCERTTARRGIFSKIFEQDWLRWLGKYSYALYVLHQAVNIVVQRTADRFYHGPVNLAVEGMKSALILIISLIGAKLSWELLEKHFIKIKQAYSS